MKKILFILPFVFLLGFSGIAQEEYWFYVRAKDSTFAPEFTATARGFEYQGPEESLRQTLRNYQVKTFKKT